MSDYKIVATKPFHKKYLKLLKSNGNLKGRLRKVLRLFKKDPFYPSLKTHKVYHNIHGDLYSSWVTGERIIWDFKRREDEVAILTLDIGTHKEVYRV